MKQLLGIFLLFIVQTAHANEQITIAAADMKFAMDEIVALFGRTHPDDRVATVYGSSGKFQTQIRQGAPTTCIFPPIVPTQSRLKKKVWSLVR